MKRVPVTDLKKAPGHWKNAVAACLDEIEAAHGHLLKKGKTPEGRRVANKWIRIQKARLKGLGYTGKVPRKPRQK